MNIHMVIAAEMLLWITVPPLTNHRDLTKLLDKGGSHTAQRATSAIRSDWPWLIEQILKSKVRRGQLVAELDQDGNTTYRKAERGNP